MGAKASKMASVAQAVATKDIPKEKRKPKPIFEAANTAASMAMDAEREPDTPDPSTTSVDLSGGSSKSNFESSLKKRRKKTRTNFAGNTGGYGGNTKLG